MEYYSTLPLLNYKKVNMAKKTGDMLFGRSKRGVWYPIGLQPAPATPKRRNYKYASVVEDLSRDDQKYMSMVSVHEPEEYQAELLELIEKHNCVISFKKKNTP